jgi:hypothetical protein
MLRRICVLIYLFFYCNIHIYDFFCDVDARFDVEWNESNMSILLSVARTQKSVRYSYNLCIFDGKFRLSVWKKKNIRHRIWSHGRELEKSCNGNNKYGFWNPFPIDDEIRSIFFFFFTANTKIYYERCSINASLWWSSKAVVKYPYERYAY